MATIGIRVAQLEDVPAIATLLERLARRYITSEFAPSAEQKFLLGNDEASLRAFMGLGYRYWVANKNDEIVGFAGVRDHSHLYHLFVAETVQRQGVARALWQTVVNACLVAGNPGRFTVNSSNNAVAVYESFGFVRSGPQQSSDGVLFNPMVLQVAPGSVD
jgi:ribosomal protein S18 acetylase RimI-like enzyme